MRLVPPFVLLEDRLGPRRGGRLYTEPQDVYACTALAEVAPTLAAIDRAAASGLHVAGWVSYACGSAFEPMTLCGEPAVGALPLVWFGAFRRCDAQPAGALDEIFGARAPDAAVEGLRAGADRATHAARVRQALELIAAGDLYQVNLTFPLRFTYAGDPLALYAALRTRQPSAHGALVATGDTWILSASPELFVEIADGMATTRPMKGTIARGADPVADAMRRAELCADPKQRAENLMIVDLLRNDLSRVCRPGSVAVPELFALETYPTLHTLTSTITGLLEPRTSLVEIFRALFPCGSVVGAPKIRAAQIIAELEGSDRGVYTGAIGAIEPGGDLRFNVAIRTATLRDGQGVYGVGGGIVADSDPDAEYDEALLKGRLVSDLAADFQLIETFGWTAEGFVRLERHLNRLARSAAVLGFACDLEALRGRLVGEAARWRGASPRRVRLVLRRDGTAETSSELLSRSAKGPRKVLLAPDPLDAADPFLRHKTTFRAAFDHAHAWAVAEGADEAILLNREGMIADAARATLFVRRGGRLITPPVEDGALPGVLREVLLERGQAVIGRLRPSDLEGADLFIGSSLRGLASAELRTDRALT